MLVHKCMINLGANSSVMPKCVADILEMKYEPIVKDVLQLDGSTVKTVGILRMLKCLTCVPRLYYNSRYINC